MPAIKLEDEVVLATPAVLAQLLGVPVTALYRPPAAQVRKATGDGEEARLPGCSCGRCHRCKDDARWNRIFEEKFADPTYYNRLTLRHDSCLAGV